MRKMIDELQTALPNHTNPASTIIHQLAIKVQTRTLLLVNLSFKIIFFLKLTAHQVNGNHVTSLLPQANASNILKFVYTNQHINAEQTKICARHTTNLKAIIINSALHQTPKTIIEDRSIYAINVHRSRTTASSFSQHYIFSLNLRNKDENANLITPLPVFVFARITSHSAVQITPLAGAYAMEHFKTLRSWNPSLR